MHRKQTESFLILSGRMGIEAGGVASEIGPGESRSVPPGTAHTFWNAGDVPRMHEVKLEPALDMEHFFEGFVTLEARHRVPPPRSSPHRALIRQARQPRRRCSARCVAVRLHDREVDRLGHVVAPTWSEVAP